MLVFNKTKKTIKNSNQKKDKKREKIIKKRKRIGFRKKAEPKEEITLPLEEEEIKDTPKPEIEESIIEEFETEETTDAVDKPKKKKIPVSYTHLTLPTN